MKKLILLSLLIAQSAWAIIIPVPMPPPGFHSEIAVPITGLDGTPLSGQTLSLEFDFPPGVFLRLFPSTTTFVSLVRLLTDLPATGFPDGTGAFLDIGLNPIFEVPLGAANSADFIAAGLVLPTLPADPLDVYGLRYTLDLPTELASVVGCELKLVGDGPFLVAPFTVPDTGTSAGLLGLGLFGLFCASQWRAGNSEGRAISPEKMTIIVTDQ